MQVMRHCYFPVFCEKSETDINMKKRNCVIGYEIVSMAYLGGDLLKPDVFVFIGIFYIQSDS